MKKFLYPTLALSALALASCSSEEPMNGNVADGPVTLKVVIPATMQSRSTLGDVIMATANNLQWSVYEVSTDGSTDPVLIYSDQKAAFSANASATATTETVTLNLGKGKTYQVAFYADNSENTFATYTDGVVNVNYANGATNDVQEDVFVGTSAVITVGVDVPSTVQLTRPFAQLNWGTNDLDEETVKHWVGNETSALEATATVKGSVYSEYDVLGAKVSGTAIDAVTFQAAKVSDFSAYTETVTFPVPEYDLVAMNYVLVSDDAPSFDCTLAFNDGFQSVEVNAATLKQNFRTNIYGALLTNPTEFNVEIAPAFETPDVNLKAEISTPESFSSALADPEISEMVVPTDLDLSDLTPEELTVTSPKTIKLENGSSLTIKSTNPMTIESELTVNGGTVMNENKDLGPGIAAQVFTVKNNATLNLENVDVIGNLDQKWHGTSDNSNVISYYDGSKVNITDCNLKGGMFVICGMFACPDAEITITNSTLESTSSSKDNGKNWAYATRLRGKSTLNNCTVFGIQGALSIDNGDATINGGNYYTYNSPGKTDAFYAVYVTNGGTCTINSGYFYGANKQSPLAGDGGTSCVVCGDNDTGKPVGNVVLNGGFYSGMPYNHTTGKTYGASEGHTMESIDLTIDGRKYIWEVK